MSEESRLKSAPGSASLPLGDLYAKHALGLRRFAAGVLRHWESAEDVVQTAFAKAAQEAQHVPPEAIKSWLYRVAFHEAINRKRRSQVDRKALEKLSAGFGTREATRPDEALIGTEDVERVRQAMRGLSDVQQRVVRARMHDGKTFAEIAAWLKLPLGTVLTHMRRALEKLRQTLHSKE